MKDKNSSFKHKTIVNKCINLYIVFFSIKIIEHVICLGPIFPRQAVGWRLMLASRVSDNDFYTMTTNGTS